MTIHMNIITPWCVLPSQTFFATLHDIHSGCENEKVNLEPRTKKIISAENDILQRKKDTEKFHKVLNNEKSPCN